MTYRVLFVLLAWLAAAAAVAYLIAPRSNGGFADDAAVLTFAALVAVGIERSLELMWTTLSQSRLGAWWPLKQFSEAFNAVEKEANDLLGPIVAETQSALEKARKGLADGSDKAEKIKEALAALEEQREAQRKRLEAAHKLAPGSERLAMVAGISADLSSALKSAVGAAEEATTKARETIVKADEAVGLAMTVAEAFNDNPARRVASILVGGGLGMIAAGFLGLNIFSAVLGVDAGYLAAGLGVVLTGFVVGLGASPFHEVVKALQNYKQSRAGMIEFGPGEEGMINRMSSETPPRGRRGAGGDPMTASRTFRLRSTQ